MRILMYHEVTSGPPEDIHAVSSAQFEAQLAWLKDNAYRAVQLADWLAGHNGIGPKVPAKSVVITFDDGYRDNYATAWPILAKHQLQATLFLIAGRMGETSSWRPGSLSQTPLMNWAQAREMAQAGFCIGSHTLSHADLARLEPAAALKELSSAREQIEQSLGLAVDSLGYPFSRFTPAVKQFARQAGYRVACSSPTGYVGNVNADPYDLRRITVLATDQLSDFAAKVRGDWRLQFDWYRRVFGTWRRRLAGAA